MTRVAWRLLVVGILGCTGGADSGPEQEPAADVEIEAPSQVVPLPPMPQVPSPERGRLVAVSAGGRDTLDGAWVARGVRCEHPPVLQVLAETTEVGTLILFHLASVGQLTGSYVVAVTDSGFPPAPAAQMGVHVSTKRGLREFLAIDGTVDLEKLNARTTGRFRVTLVEPDTQDSLRHAGVFLDVPVEASNDRDCEGLAEQSGPPDSALVPLINGGP